jgi:F0F1-type ATP synthase assembly protein I
VFDLATKRKINKGFSDGFNRAVEIVATPVLLGFLGSLVDGWLGTRPAFTLGFGIFGVCGIVAKLWLGYDREMKAEEAALAARTTDPEVQDRVRPANAAPKPVDMRLDAGIGRTARPGATGEGSAA